MSNSPPASKFRRLRLSQAKDNGMLVLCICMLCRRREAYVASDLVIVYGDMAVEDFGGGGCRKCGREGCVRARAYFPKPEDIGHIELLRPDGWQKVWSWHSEWLDLPIKQIGEDGSIAPDKPLPGLWGG